MFTIEGFNSPIVSLVIKDDVELIFITTADKNIYLYHNITYGLVEQMADKTVYRPENKVSCMYYHGVGDHKYFYTGGNRLSSFCLER